MSKKGINWRIYERANLYPQHMSAYLDLIRLKPSAQYPYLANRYDVIFYRNDYMWWARDADYLSDKSRQWIHGWLTDKQKRRALTRRYELSLLKSRPALVNLKKKISRQQSTQALYQLYAGAKSLFLSHIAFAEYSLDIFDDFFDSIFTGYVSQLNGSTLNRVAAVSEMLKPAYVSQSLEYQRTLLRLSLGQAPSVRQLENVAAVFSWIMMSWDGGNELSVSHVQKDLRQVLKKTTSSRKKELARIDQLAAATKENRKRFMKKNSLPASQLQPYFYLLDQFAKFHDWRKEIQMRSNQVILRVLKILAQHYRVRYRDLLFYYNDEVKDLCLRQEKVAASVIKSRQRGFTWVIRFGNVREFVGNSAQRAFTSLVGSTVAASGAAGLVTGTPASPGVAVGRALVAKSARVAKRLIKAGDVLVTSMTTVDYLPAMRRAAAIVTDDGGVTCHAAIVSRELGIPCIVGTRNATRLIKNGERVAVDANDGTVRRV